MKQFKRHIKFILIGLIFVSVIFIIPHQLSNRIKLEVVSFLELPLKVSSFVSAQIKNVIFYPYILRENISLRNKVGILETENVRLKECLRENERLRALLFFKPEPSFSLIATRVIAKDTSGYKKSITIDKGLGDGIYLDMPVITTAGLVGWVKSVGRMSAQVMLITDVNSRVAAIVQNTRFEGIVEGTGDACCRLKFVEADADFKEGQLIITSALSSIVPKGFIIGRIKEINYARGEVQKIALIKPGVDFNRLEEVLCVNSNL